MDCSCKRSLTVSFLGPTMLQLTLDEVIELRRDEKWKLGYSTMHVAFASMPFSLPIACHATLASQTTLIFCNPACPALRILFTFGVVKCYLGMH